MRGVIMETKNGRAVLLTKRGEFVNIKDKNYSVGDKVNITFSAGRLCAMAASLIIVCVGIGSYFVPAGYVSVDINPSLMMTVNIYNRVIEVKSLNDDARVLLNKINIKGKSTEDSVEILIKTSEELGYINKNNRSVILDVVPGITRPHIESVEYNNIDIAKEVSDMETFRIAQNIGVSIAKAKALEEYTEKNGGDIHSNAVKLNDKSVKEIRRIMLESSDLSDKKTDDVSPQNPIPQETMPDNISKPPKPQENYKPPYSINNPFPVSKPELKNIPPADQPPETEYIPAENISYQDDGRPQELPPASDEQPLRDIAPINDQPRQPEQKPEDDNISQSSPRQTIEPEQKKPPVYSKPLQAEQKPQENTPFRSGSKQPPGRDPAPNEPAHRNDKPSVSGQQITEQKSGASNQDGENANNPSQSDEQNPDMTMPSDKQPPEEQKPNPAEQGIYRPQDNPGGSGEPKHEPVTEQGSQPPNSDDDAYKPQNDPQPAEPKPENNMPPQEDPQPQGNEPMQNNSISQPDSQQPSGARPVDPSSRQPQQSEPDPHNNSDNHITSKGMVEHGENKEIP